MKNSDSKILTQCLSDMHDIISVIHTELNIIDIKLKCHDKKYFKNWRSANIQNNIENLKNYNKIMLMRLDILFKVLLIPSNFHKIDKKK